MPTFLHGPHRIAYTEHGSGERTVVLVHGLLFNQKLMTPLAEHLGRRGYRVVTLDLLGHGASDRPREMWSYSMTAFGEQVIGLLDHLEVEQAVVGGLSLGANTALEAAAFAPDRVCGLIVEMPVLDHALIGCAVAFTPLMLALTVGEPVMRVVSAVTRRIPTGTPALAPVDVALDWVRQDPRPSGALLQGLFFARVAPPSRVRRTLRQPTLVIGHRRDPIHPFTDAGALAEELPNARLVEAGSILEMRLAPKRLTREVKTFLQQVWPADGEAAPAAASSSAA
ncbi:MAG: alpha/beta hydrolase [Solirubrobacterales bacterium]|nr:alpha/beta hydrolase [Solirubrobacterales bacterium]